MGIGRHGLAHGIEFVAHCAAGPLPLLRDTFARHAFDLEARRIGVAPGAESLETAVPGSLLRRTALRLRQHHVRRDQPFVISALEQGKHRADARISEPFSWGMRGLHQVSGGLVPVIAVGQAADERELVRLFGQVRKQLADVESHRRSWEWLLGKLPM